MFWGGEHSLKHHCLLWQFFGGLKNGLFTGLRFVTSWESICWLFFEPTLMALCLNAVSQVFCPGHHIFQVPLNSDTSGLRQTSFIYFRSGLAEPCQGFLWACVWFAGSKSASAESPQHAPKACDSPRHLGIDSWSCITEFPHKNLALSLQANGESQTLRSGQLPH